MDKETVDTYNRKAEEYASETDDFWQRFPSDFVSRFTKELPKDGRVLDIGCGQGRDAEIFKKAGLQPVCLDASESMVRLCEQKGFESVQGNFLDLPFEPKSFDGVWAYTSLLHIHKDELPLAIQQIKKVLKPGGVVGIGLIEGEGEERKLSMGEDYPRLFSYYTLDEVKRILEGFSFEEIYSGKHPVKARSYLHFLYKNI